MIVVMMRLNWLERQMVSQILRIQAPSDLAFDTLFDKPFLKYTSVLELISVDRVHSGLLTELTYRIGMKKSIQVQAFLTELRNLNANNRVTLIACYNSTDL